MLGVGRSGAMAYSSTDNHSKQGLLALGIYGPGVPFRKSEPACVPRLKFTRRHGTHVQLVT